MGREKSFLILAPCAAMLLLVFFCAGGDTVKNILTAAASLALTAIAFASVDKRTRGKRDKGTLTVLMTAAAVIAVSLYCAMGFVFGSNRVILLASFIWTHVLPITVAAVATELARGRMLVSKNRYFSILSCIVFILTDAVLIASAGDISSLGKALIPAIFSNFLYHFIASRYGATPNIPYKIIILVYPYFIPMRPLIPEALLALLRVIWPLLLCELISGLVSRADKPRPSKQRKIRVAGFSLFIILCTSFVLLISSVLESRLMIVGSDSMSGALETGDVIIYDAFDGQAVSQDDIILFERDGRVIIHRVIDVKRINSEMRYYTKGDANATADEGYVTDDDIVGIKRMRIRYIGYPSIWIRSLAH